MWASCEAVFLEENMKKLIIWDFDGVIADTEKLWVINRMEVLNQSYGTNWSLIDTFKNIGGMSDNDKKVVFAKLGINIDDAFWKKVWAMDAKKYEEGFVLTDGLEDIFNNKNFEQCIATGGIKNKTKLKIESVGIRKYFPEEKVFTVDMVKVGKPEPDLFLLAAKSMGYEPKDCIVVEDSLAGLRAAISAKMTPVAFIQYSNDYYKEEIKKMPVEHVFDNMKDVNEFLIKNFS